jgi:NitT/TauT family transport system substrate-binding protein
VKKSWLAWAFTLVLAVATACGGAGEDLSGGGNQNAQSSGGLKKVKVQDTTGAPAYFVMYGMRKGFFQQNGLELQFQPSSGGATVIPGLMSGELDVAGSNVVSAMLAMDRGMPITMIASGTSTQQKAEDDYSAIMVSGNSRVRDAKGLEGTTIAVNTLQNINDTVIHGVLKQAGANTSSVKYVEMPFPDMIPAIKRGDVDAGMLIEPFVTRGAADGLREVASPYHTLRPGLQTGTYLMTRQKVEQDPGMVKAFQEGVRLTAESIRTDPDSFRKALPEIAGFDPGLAQKVVLPDWKASSDRASLEMTHQVMREIGMAKGNFDYNASVRY